jgi:hypothetical protein
VIQSNKYAKIFFLFILNLNYAWCDRNSKYFFQDVFWSEQKKNDFTKQKNSAKVNF